MAPTRAAGLAAASLAIALIGTVQPAQAATCSRLNLYSSQPLHGPAAPEGRDLIAAERLALDQARRRAGGRRIEFVALDDSTEAAGGWDRATVTANATRAAQDPCAIAYLGEYNSSASAVS